MSRRKKRENREILPDPKYNNILVTQFINSLMRKGKKGLAEKILYQTLELMQQKMHQDGLVVFQKAVNNVKPLLEVVSRRIGGATYQVPIEVSPARKVALAIRWLLNYARERSGRNMSDKLANELMAAFKNEGNAMKKRNDVQRMAEANKAFAHYK